MIKKFEKWREVLALNLLNLVLKRYWKSMETNFFKCVRTLVKPLDPFTKIFCDGTIGAVLRRKKLLVAMRLPKQRR